MPVFSPRQGNFVLNDVDLHIPPTQISIHKEDLTWEWKTLRTKSSTKVPSGQGLVQILCRVVFTPELLLDLHRLVCQFRHSPFCYVENEFIRQSIVPQWPLYQQMALTLTALNVSPMPGAPGTFVAEMDFRWFNYLPYSFNYLFREEWQTAPILGKDGNGWARYSIPYLGFEARVGENVPVSSGITSPSQPAPPGALQRYNLLVSQMEQDNRFDLQSLEALHYGIVFYGLPLPSRMERSRMVSEPGLSNIYVRYLNSLQQKALFENFGIDCYQDLAAGYGPIGIDPNNPFIPFSTGEEEPGGLRRVHGLHSDRVPEEIRQQWIDRMLETTHRVDFLWDSYLQIRYPTDVMEGLDRLRKQVLEGLTATVKSYQARHPGSDFNVPRAARIQSNRERAERLSKSLLDGEGVRIDPRVLLAIMEKESSAQNTAVNFQARKAIKAIPFLKGKIAEDPDPKFDKKREVTSRANFQVALGIVQGSPELKTQSNLRKLVAAMGFGTFQVHPHLEMQLPGGFDSEGRIQNASRVEQFLDFFDGDPEACSDALLLRYMASKSTAVSGAQKVVDGDGTDPETWRDFAAAYNGDEYRENDYHTKIAKHYEQVLAVYGDLEEQRKKQEEEEEEEEEEAKKAEEADVELGENLLGLTEEQRQSFHRGLTALFAEGYNFYDQDPSLVNVFHKTHHLQIAHVPAVVNLPEEAQEAVQTQGAVVTLAGGGLRHVVASLPLLGHEFPTHQHLGSIEPTYLMEFALLAGEDEAAGLPDDGRLLETMRGVLQENARGFRLVPDSHALTVDHFITRLLGSFREKDLQEDLETGALHLKKRALVSRTTTATVEGHPGLSSLQMQLSETNPYQSFSGEPGEAGPETLQATESKSPDLEERRKQVLQALHSLQLNDVGQTAAVLASGQQIEAERLQEMDLVDQFRWDTEGLDPEGEYVLFDTRNNAPSIGEGYVELASNALGQHLSTLGYGTQGALSALGDNLLEMESLRLGAAPMAEILYFGGEGGGNDPQVAVLDATEFFKLHPELDQPGLIEEVFAYRQILEETCRLGRKLLAEEKLAGISIREALDAGQVTSTLYGLPFQGEMIAQYAYYRGLRGRPLYDPLGKPLPPPTVASDREVLRDFWWTTENLMDTARFAVPTALGLGLAPFTTIGLQTADSLVSGTDPWTEQVDAWKREFALDYFQETFPEELGIPTALIDYLPIPRIFRRDFQSSMTDTFLAINDGRPFDLLIKESAEKAKLEYLKTLLQETADRILNRTDILKLFGLEKLANFDVGINVYRGQECYPDMDLPEHPYYQGQRFATFPDFYHWNLYEDASDGVGGLTREAMDELYRQMQAAVEGPYRFLKSMQGKGIDIAKQYGKKIQLYAGDVNLMPKLSRLVHHPEGSDQGDYFTESQEWINTGPFLESFPPASEWDVLKARGQKAIEEIEAEILRLESQTSPNTQIARAHTGTGPDPKDKARELQLKELKRKLQLLKGFDSDVKPLLPLLSQTDGNPQYGTSTRGQLEDYQRYLEKTSKIRSIDSMFGSRAGYLGELLNDDNAHAREIRDALTDTQVAALDTYSHGFSLDALKKLAWDSSKDILAQKLTLRRAFPTFKLYFVEEDEAETRFINFDDFYSYNAVRQFEVVQSRKVAADTATIVLQNISGTLDGTKRNAIVDLDYFSAGKAEKIKKQLQSSRIETEAGSLVEKSPVSADQPFQALVLRPGMNVQLRAGYANDPDLLEVLVSGRVTDISWSETGDLVELVVQSFGVELVQALIGQPGMTPAGDVDIQPFETTHQLLGSLMLRPEILHFGRWEFGARYQVGESKDHRLDFVDYREHTFMGRFGVTNSLFRWMSNHPGWTSLFVTGLTLGAMFVPGTKGTIGFFGKLIRGVAPRALGGIGVGISRGAAISQAARASLTRVSLARGPAALAAEYSARIATAIEAAAPGFRSAIARTPGTRSLAGVNRAVLAVARSAASNQGVASAQSLRLLDARLAQASRLAIRKEFFGLQVARAAKVGFWRAGLQYARAPWTAGLNLATTSAKLGVGLLAGAVALDLASELMLEPLYDKMVLDLKRWYARKQVSMMLSPQDDNLYPPSPKDYMTLEDKRIKKNLFWLGAEGILGIPDLTANWELWTNPKDRRILEKRVEVDQCEYTPQGVTVWEIFQEMTLRHPGWVAAARPYGGQFRYTMFFGVPSQRYWSKPANNHFIDRMNQLRLKLEKGAISQSQYEQLYSKQRFEQIRRQVERESPTGEQVAFEQQMNAAPMSPTPEEQARVEDNRLRQQGEAQADYETHLQIRMTTEVMEEYLRGLELRFVPFRRYHVLTSEQDIIRNGIVSSEHDVANAASVVYYDPKNPEIPQGSAMVKANGAIPPHMEKMTEVHYPNCRGYTMALRYGIGALLWTMREMYRGEILVLGNPRIRPLDICVLMDSYNDMVGPIEVEQVVHLFSHETGFVTEIKPNAVVFSNEISTYPVLEALKLTLMAVKDHEEGPKGADASGLVDQIPYQKMVSERFRQRLSERYQELYPEGFSLDHVISEEDQQALNELPGGAAFLLPGLLGAAVYGPSGAVAGTGVWVAGKLARGGTSGLAKAVASRSGWLGLAAFGVTTTYGAWQYSQWVDNPSTAWLVAGHALFLKSLEEEAIGVVPLLKNGHPVVSGLSLQSDPAMIWRNIKGKITNVIDDTLEGTNDFLHELRTYGWSMWRRFQNPDERLTR